MLIIEDANHYNPKRPSKVHAVARTIDLFDGPAVDQSICTKAHALTGHAREGTIEDVTCKTCLCALKRRAET